MPLKAALVDRARAVYNVEDTAGQWTEGQPPATLEVGPWFPCRLSLLPPRRTYSRAGQASAGEAGGYERSEGAATLIFGTRYEDDSSLTDGEPGEGHFLAFELSDRLEVESLADAHRIWWVDTALEPLRKKRKVIGWSVNLRHALEPQVLEAVLAGSSPAPAGESGL